MPAIIKNKLVKCKARSSAACHSISILLGAMIWSISSVCAAARSDIVVVLSDDRQSYLYKETVSCEETTCLYKIALANTPLWIVDENAKPLLSIAGGYKLVNTSISLIYQATPDITIQSPGLTQLSIPLSHLEITDKQSSDAVKQRTIIALPGSLEVTQYSSNSKENNWRIFDNILKLEGLSTADSTANIVVNSATDNNLQINDNTSTKPSIKETPTTCSNVLDMLLATSCEGSFVIEELTFNRNSASLSPSARAILDNLIHPMKESTTPRFEIAVYTDSKGPARWNRSLSQERAETIRQYLIFKGINPNRLVVNGYGESNPIASNSTPQGRSKNRRVELRRYSED